MDRPPGRSKLADVWGPNNGPSVPAKDGSLQHRSRHVVLDSATHARIEGLNSGLDVSNKRARVYSMPLLYRKGDEEGPSSTDSSPFRQSDGNLYLSGMRTRRSCIITLTTLEDRWAHSFETAEANCKKLHVMQFLLHFPRELPILPAVANAVLFHARRHRPFKINYV